MRNRGFLMVGSLLIVWGGLILLSNLFNIDFWSICWPLALILVGVWLLVRPRPVIGGAHIHLSPLNNTRRSGAWKVADEEIFTLVGNTRLDMTQAEIQPGETVLRVYGFVGDLNLRLPQDVAFSVSSWAFVNDVRILNQKHDGFVTPVEYASPNYESAEKKMRLETFFFVLDLDIFQD